MLYCGCATGHQPTRGMKQSHKTLTRLHASLKSSLKCVWSDCVNIVTVDVS